MVPLRGIEPRPDAYKATARPSCYRGKPGPDYSRRTDLATLPRSRHIRIRMQRHMPTHNEREPNP